MANGDPHSALKRDVIAQTNRDNLQVVLARLQKSKADVAYSLHVNPSSFSSYGVQTTDFLAYLGFTHSDQCPFVGGGGCYVRWVPEGFDVEGFIAAFTSAY